MGSLLRFAVRPVYLCANVGPWGVTHRSACPALCHSESGPLGLSARTWGRRVCQWSDCLPRWSYTPPVSVPHGNASPLRPSCPSPPLLPVWMNVYFLSPWCRTSLPFDFLSVLVVRGGAVCLPTLPSWFSPTSGFSKTKYQSLLSKLKYGTILQDSFLFV